MNWIGPVFIQVLVIIADAVAFLIIRSRKPHSNSVEDILGEKEQIPEKGPSMDSEDKDLFKD